MISGNHMAGNTIVGNLRDAVDTHADCGENVWKDTLFHAGNPSCVH